RHYLPTRCSRRPHSQRFPILPSAHARFLPRPNEGSANGANAKPTGLPASVSHQGRICAAGDRSWHCELNPVGRAVVVHSRRLRRRSGFGGLAALLTVATDGPQGVLTETLGIALASFRQGDDAPGKRRTNHS